MSEELPLSDRARSLRAWYRRKLGRQLADAELSALTKQLDNLFGFHLVMIDPPWNEYELDGSRIAHRVVQSVEHNGRSGAALTADTENWPLMTDTIDTVILPHTLELARDPHQVLREADRCLVPDGHLVILGFNPYSLWGVRRLLARKRGKLPWDTRFRSLGRIKDWLGLLGFDTLETRYLFQRPPVQSERVLRRLRFMDAGSGGLMLLSAAYILVARKRTVIMTPIRGLQRNKPRLFPVGIPSSSQGNVRRNY